MVDGEDWLQSVQEELVTPIIEVFVDKALLKTEIHSAPVYLGLLIDDYFPRETVVRHCRVEWITLLEDILQSRVLLLGILPDH